MTIALTGSTGFIGRHLLPDLRAGGYRVRSLVRGPTANGSPDTMCIGDLTRLENYEQCLEGVDTVIHAAGLARAGLDPAAYEKINAQVTRSLAWAAERAGVRRFIFLSSVRAQAGAASPDVLTEAGPANPDDAYGRSKLAAERALAGISSDWVALRLPPVYGPGASGSIARLQALARYPLPLPFASLTGRRSLLAIPNLAAAVRVAMAAQGPLCSPLLVADGEALTLPEIVAAMRRGLGRSSNLAPFPRTLLDALMRLAGQKSLADTLIGSLVVDAGRLRSLGWRPLVSAEAALADYAREGNACCARRHDAADREPSVV